MDFDGVTLDGIRWRYEGREWIPLCPRHYIRLDLTWNGDSRCRLECAEDTEIFDQPRSYHDQRRYIQNKLDAKELRKLKYLNIDGEYTVIAEDEAKTKGGRYFVKARLTESRVGLQLVVYAGEKGREKTQIFVEPDIKRLSFDQTNTHPTDVFLKLEATFDDGSTASIEKRKA